MTTINAVAVGNHNRVKSPRKPTYVLRVYLRQTAASARIVQIPSNKNNIEWHNVQSQW